MNTTGKLLIVLALTTTIVGVVILKHRNAEDSQADTSEHTQPEQNQIVENTSKEDLSQRKENEGKALPRLVDLGAGKCIPCKMMAPILAELKQEYQDQLVVDVYDVEENRDYLDEYNVRVIPTQIFYDGSGQELFRHEGFMAKGDILAKWKELGIFFE